MSSRWTRTRDFGVILRRLIGKMAHPLNQPRLDPATGRVVEGHAVLQPRVATALPTATRARSISACSPA